MNNRIEKLRAKLTEEQTDSFLVSSSINIRYLTGFSSSNALLLIGREGEFLITDFRYEEEARSKASGCEVRIAQNQLWEELSALPPKVFGEKMDFESQYLPFEQYLKFKEALPLSVSLIPKSGLIESFSVIKDKSEIEKIRRAVEITDGVFEQILPLLKPGISELELAAEIDYRIRKSGGEKAAFDTIVASGERSSMPHATPTGRKLQNGELVLMDFGAVFDGYASDFTRTVVLGEATQEQKQRYNLVRQAQREAITTVKAGMYSVELDKTARQIIENAGYGSNFRHSLGHGVGLQVHEAPRISWKNGTILRSGMVVTVEPGIYLPGWGGIRIENMILVEEDGCEELTKTTTEFISLHL
jgi:Xaa-Pro aminopeptidase